MIMNGRLITPSQSDNILIGITRDTVMRIAKDMGLEVKEAQLPREMLYVSD